jgi:general secretion pathway protein K
MRIALKGKTNDGIAIFIVLVAIFALSAIAAAFAYSMKVETRLAANSNNSAELDCLGRSGIEVARWILSQEMKTPGVQYDALNQVWAGGPGETNDVLAGFDFDNIASVAGLPGIIHRPQITDAESKFNINYIFGNEELVQHALINMGVDAAEVPNIIACIEDWIDTDDDTRLNGAETDYYQSLDPPYEAKNGPIDDISELLFVKGVTPDIFSSNAAPSAVQAARDATRSGVLPNAAVVTNAAKMVDVFTSISNGRINVNTASATVLQMIPGVDENAASQIIAARNVQPFQNLGEVVANTSLGGASQGNASTGVSFASVINRYGTVRSAVFEVKVAVEIGMTKRTYYALLIRNNPADIQILNMHWQ